MQIGFFACVQYFNLRVTYLTPRLNYNNFLKFDMPTANVDFQNLISEHWSPWAADFPSWYQIWFENIDRRGNYGSKSKSKMAAVRHLGVSKIRILSTGTHWASDFLSLYQIWRKIVDRRRNYGRKSKSKMAAVRHLEFSKTWFLRTGSPWAADFQSRYQIWFENIDRRGNYGPKSKSKMAAVGHLGFSKIRLLNTGTPFGLPIFHHCTKFGAKMLIDAEIITENRNPRWRSSAILDLSHHHIGPPTKSIHWATLAFPILC